MATARPPAFTVIGGGLLGMGLALELADRGHSVRLIERAPELGGLAAVWQVPTVHGTVTWDRHYHVLLRSDTELLALLRRIGLDAQVRWRATRTGCFVDGQLHDVTSPAAFLRLPAPPLTDRLRIAATMAMASVRPDWRRLEGKPLDRWLQLWSGRRGFELFWRPLLEAKLGDAHHEASAAFLWATMHRLAGARGRGAGNETFGTVRGGFAAILDRLAGALRSAGVEVLTDTQVRAVRPTGAGVVIETTRGDLEGGRVVVTAPAPAVADLLPDLRDAERAAWQAVRYQGVVCASVLLDRPLDGYYLTNILDRSELTGVVEMTSLVDPAEVGGQHLVYLPRYVAPDDPLFDESDEALRARFLDALARITPRYRPEHVTGFAVSRVRHVFPVPTVGFSTKVPAFATSIPGVHVVSAAQIVNGTLNVNESLALVRKALPVITTGSLHRQPLREAA